MEMVDKTGQLRSDEDVKEAIQVVTEFFIKHAIEYPRLTLVIPTIRDSLFELLGRRQAMKDWEEGK